MPIFSLSVTRMIRVAYRNSMMNSTPQVRLTA